MNIYFLLFIYFVLIYCASFFGYYLVRYIFVCFSKKNNSSEQNKKE